MTGCEYHAPTPLPPPGKPGNLGCRGNPKIVSLDGDNPGTSALPVRFFSLQIKVIISIARLSASDALSAVLHLLRCDLDRRLLYLFGLFRPSNSHLDVECNVAGLLYYVLIRPSQGILCFENEGNGLRAGVLTPTLQHVLTVRKTPLLIGRQEFRVILSNLRRIVE